MISNLNKSSVVDPNQKAANASRLANNKQSKSEAKSDDLSELLSASPSDVKIASGKSAPSALKGEERKESFDAQLAQAGAMANAMAGAQVPVNPMNPKAALGFGTQAHMTQAEYSPLTAKSAASLTSGSSVAGLKPWSQDWIFEGMEHPGAGSEQIRPLIGGGSQAEELAQFKAALQQMQMQNPGAAQVINLRSRGDQGTQSNIGNPTVAVAGGADEKEAMASIQEQLASRLSQQLGSQVEGDAEMGGAVGLEQSVSQMSGQMNGQIVGQNSMQKNTSEKKGLAIGSASGLSGAEFLKTLTDVRSGKGIEQMTSVDGDKTGAVAVQSRPELTLIDNSLGSRGKKAIPELSSGEDFMSSSNAMRSAAASAGGIASVQTPTGPTIVTGHVVQGNNAQDRLSHEAVLGMSNAIKSLGQNGGEMKIHLKPENLGDLHLRVSTQGRDVGLQILASDETAKKILQDSIGSLKDSLATQNLTLGKIELSVGKMAQSESSHHQQSGNNGQPSNMSQTARDMMGQNAGQQNQGSGGRWSDSTQDDGSFSARPLRVSSASASAAMAAQARSRSARDDGRLDVRA